MDACDVNGHHDSGSVCMYFPIGTKNADNIKAGSS